MIRIGLTGSIGMGKSTTSRMFAACGVAGHDADAVVHMLYSGRAAALIETEFPGTVIDGKVDRTLLSPHVLGKPDAIKRLEAIVHPLVRAEEAAFLAKASAEGRRAVLLDIPLMFETGGDGRVDVCVVVTADAVIQRARVLARSGMTTERFEAILARQMPDAEKRRRAHFLIDTGLGLKATKRSVECLLRAIAALP
ncbi:dephospho-CoA kinase [Roseibium algae]|uniref:Dephospho-CoA kinase n=1 Tax=Roseibium algae TaxID=3123038 RepID=A0ABU8TLB1_9HYPH